MERGENEVEISGAQLCADLKQVRKKYFTNEVRTPLNLFIYLFIFFNGLENSDFWRAICSS